MPGAFNPLTSRLVFVATLLGIFGVSYFSEWVRQNLRWLAIAGTWLITFHYFYLFYGNTGDVNWIVGAYITVIAINLCIQSTLALLSYSIFVLLLSAGLVYLVPSLAHSVFLPGMMTIALQANLGLRSRLVVIKRLTESNERFELLFNSTFEGVFVHEKGFILDVNEAMLRMLKYSRHELIGMHLLSLLHPDARRDGEEKMKEVDLGPFETQGMTKDHKSIDVEVRAKNCIYNKKPARLVTILDVSDRKKAEKERIAALTLAENLRLRDDFISIASHELRTPISALELQMNVLEHYSQENLPKPFQEAMGLFGRQINRLTELVETMLDVPRMSSGKFTLDFKQVDLVEAVHRVIRSLPVLPNQKNPTIDVHGPDVLLVRGDKVRLEQVVENLLTNARKYGNGKPITVQLRDGASEVCIAVEDQGIGIAPENRERIFERFERGMSARNITGFGLGLYIVRKIVEAHGGRIDVESVEHHGSTFSVYLPKR